MAIRYMTSTYDQAAGRYVNKPEVVGVGTTISKGVRSTRIMSDVWGSEEYAEYWDAESGKIKTVITEVWEYSRDTAKQAEITIDATPDVWCAIRDIFYAEALSLEIQNAIERATQVVKDDTVTVIKGRTHVGLTGKVVVVMSAPYSTGYNSQTETKFGVAMNDIMVDRVARNGKTYKSHRDVAWVWARNCKKVGIPAIDMAACEQAAMTTAMASVNRKIQQAGLRTTLEMMLMQYEAEEVAA